MYTNLDISLESLTQNEMELYQEYFLDIWVERFQKKTAKPMPLGAVFPENLVPYYDYDLYSEGMWMGNTTRVYENYELFLKEFKVYLDICIHLGSPVYPSKEYFLRHLYISGDRGFLNLRPVNADVYVHFLNGKEHLVSHHYQHFSDVVKRGSRGDDKQVITRHYCEGVAKYYKGEVHDLAELEGVTPWFFMDINSVSDKDFQDIFCPHLAKRRLQDGTSPHREYATFIKDLVQGDIRFKQEDITQHIRKGYRRSPAHELIFSSSSRKTVYLIDDTLNRVIKQVSLLEADERIAPILNGAEEVELTSDYDGEVELYRVSKIFVNSGEIVRVHLDRVGETK